MDSLELCNIQLSKELTEANSIFQTDILDAKRCQEGFHVPVLVFTCPSLPGPNPLILHLHPVGKLYFLVFGHQDAELGIKCLGL